MQSSDNADGGGLIGKLNLVEKGYIRTDSTWVRRYGKHGWYVPNTNPYPLSQKLFERPLQEIIREIVLPGHTPSAPLLGENDVVMTLGSCFARELRRALSDYGFEASALWVPSGLNNTYALLDFFTWCVTGEETGRGFRYERDASGVIDEWKPAQERQAYADAFSRVGCFVFTIGLAEVWQDRETGGVFWRGVPLHLFNEQRHVFRLTTVEENTANLRQLVRVIRQVNQKAPIIITLSPVPLLASFRDISCLTADCVSKSVLRVAIDQLMSERGDGVYYWPSFEVVRWVGAHLPYTPFGKAGKTRDVNRDVVAAIIDAFIEAYYTPEARERIRARQPDPATADPAVDEEA